MKKETKDEFSKYLINHSTFRCINLKEEYVISRPFEGGYHTWDSLHLCGAFDEEKYWFYLGDNTGFSEDHMQINMPRINALAHDKFLIENIIAINCDSEWLHIYFDKDSEEVNRYGEDKMEKELEKILSNHAFSHSHNCYTRSRTYFDGDFPPIKPFWDLFFREVSS